MYFWLQLCRRMSEKNWRFHNVIIDATAEVLINFHADILRKRHF
jgi:DNA-binding GntR family transcriptional regulator